MGGGNVPPYSATVTAAVGFNRVHVRLDEPFLPDVAARVDEALRDCGVEPTPDTEIAIAVGSRGITDLAMVIARVAAWVRAQGARPFLVSAMGSHGGAS